MQDFITSIYHDNKILLDLKRILDDCLIDNPLEYNRIWSNNLQNLIDICNLVEQEIPGKGQKLFSQIKLINENIGDSKYVESALMETIIPTLYEYLQKWAGIDVTENGWQLLSSASGMLTIKDSSNGRLIHSIDDPLYESYKRAEAIYQPYMSSFFICGCGLGYLAKALYDISLGSLDIYVLEPSKEIISYAREYGLLDEIPSEKLHVFTGKDHIEIFTKWFEIMEKCGQDKIGTYFDANVRHHFVPEIANIIYSVRSQNAVALQFSKLEDVNFYRNIENIHDSVSNISDDIDGKECIVVAAGPSLDDNIEFIRESVGKRIILAVSTVVGKLQKLGIKYDYVLVMDPQERTYGHMTGVETNVPMIAAPRAYWKFSHNNDAKVYLAPVSGNTVHDEYIKSHYQVNKLWDVAGTVTNLALYTALELGASCIYLVGADLAYPNGNSHSSDTMDFKKMDTAGLIEVRSNSGGSVLTSDVFVKYIQQMEAIIDRYKKKGIPIYNLSKEGAKIEGTRVK